LNREPQVQGVVFKYMHGHVEIKCLNRKRRCQI